MVRRTRSYRQVEALAIADMHLSHTAPAARSNEPDWYVAMSRYIEQLREMRTRYGSPPVLCAGDIFDRWDSPPELINWATENLPPMFAIPGQHDMPHHNADEMKKSAFRTLCDTRTIISVDDRTKLGSSLEVYGFPWGTQPKARRPRKRRSGRAQVALVHKYVWKGNASYVEAPAEQHYGRLAGPLFGYDVAIFGDNHKRFVSRVGACSVVNCGCFIPRRWDERLQKPAVSLIWSDGNVSVETLGVEEDKWVDRQPDERLEQSPEMKELVAELQKINPDSLDFREVMKAVLGDNKVGEKTKAVLRELLGV